MFERYKIGDMIFYDGDLYGTILGIKLGEFMNCVTFHMTILNTKADVVRLNLDELTAKNWTTVP